MSLLNLLCLAGGIYEDLEVSKMTAREFLEKTDIGVFAIEASQSVYDAINMMIEKRINSVIVNDQGRTVGIFTERETSSGVISLPAGCLSKRFC